MSLDGVADASRVSKLAGALGFVAAVLKPGKGSIGFSAKAGSAIETAEMHTKGPACANIEVRG